MSDNPWRVAVTGIGLVTPLGLTAAETAARVLRGDSGCALRTDDQAGVAAAQIPPFDIAGILRNPKNLKLMSRPVRLALLATRQAVDQSGLADSGIASERTGVYVGSGQTGIEYEEFFKALTLAWEGGREQDYKYLGGMPARVLDRYFSLRTLANAGVSAISTEFGVRGPSNNYVQEEIAPAVAIYNACQDLMEQRCDAAVVCGFDSLLVPSIVMAFRRVGLLAGDGLATGYLPFHPDRNGIVLGEGAGSLILERRSTAEARQCAILAEIDGVGFASNTQDAAGLTVRAEDICEAASDALGGTIPDFAVARGLGTPADDLAESRALRGCLSPSAHVTALKGHTGYLGAATAVVELGIGLLCASQGWIPAVRGLSRRDPQVELPLVSEKAVRVDSLEPKGLFFSASFGGQVAAISARAKEVSARRE